MIHSITSQRLITKFGIAIAALAILGGVSFALKNRVVSRPSLKSAIELPVAVSRSELKSTTAADEANVKIEQESQQQKSGQAEVNSNSSYTVERHDGSTDVVVNNNSKQNVSSNGGSSSSQNTTSTTINITP